MKKAVFLLLLACFATGLKAQDSTKSLFKTKATTDFSMFARGGMQYSRIAGANAWPIDIMFGLGVNRWRFGMGIESLVNNIPVAPHALIAPYNRMRWSYSTFSAAMEYNIMPKRIVSFAPGVAFGYGTISKHPMDGPNLDHDGELDDSQFFVLKPYLNANLRLTRIVSLYAGGGYRFSFGEGTQGITDRQLSGPFGVLGIKLEIGGDWGL